MSAITVDAGKVKRQILVILDAWGMAPDLAQTAADIMVETDLLGVDSHGVSMLMMYEDMRNTGMLSLQSRPRVVRDRGCTALLDGGAGLGHPVSAMAMTLAADKALEHGVGVVGVRNSHHFGAAGLYARMASARGLVGLVTTATRGMTMVPPRGAAPVLGTNPLAFAAPAGRNPAFVLDMSTTTVAANKVKVYQLNDTSMPAGWVVDPAGQPVIDPQAGMDYVFRQPEGGLTPLGGSLELGSHKGYGLAMMVHILGGTLTGASFSPIRNRTQKPGDPDNIGHFFMAIDPDAFRDEGEFESDLDAVIDTMHATPPADPDEPVMVAGEPEMATREQRLREGIPIPARLDAHIREICARSGADYVLQ
ncbi:Ldh family oxidoreductase [Bordetella genomosp. 12]|uniref:Malate dehydrogenase n=1 Tax=Bordetella genomosp. 12 TaxID=463035 RepID=A0A261VCF3_9BORD|nr:Ldh family oxidoreductase [Bordetella genomosp. 12]OZI71826.1 malate dehydrogenase [Bordetella genomosp. 12]